MNLHFTHSFLHYFYCVIYWLQELQCVFVPYHKIFNTLLYSLSSSIFYSMIRTTRISHHDDVHLFILYHNIHFILFLLYYIYYLYNHTSFYRHFTYLYFTYPYTIALCITPHSYVQIISSKFPYSESSNFNYNDIFKDSQSPIHDVPALMILNCLHREYRRAFPSKIAP